MRKLPSDAIIEQHITEQSNTINAKENVMPTTQKSSLKRAKKSNKKIINAVPVGEQQVTLVMDIDEWADINTCRIQRDTARHANTAIHKHLADANITHRNVSAAMLPNGTMYKLDGHTRSHMWQNGTLATCFETLSVTVYKVKTLDDIDALYKTFDNRDATESAKDKFLGACRKWNVSTESALIRSGPVSAALTLIEGKTQEFDVYSVTEYWQDILTLVDSKGYKSGTRCPTGIMAALLVTYYIERDGADDFWGKYLSDSGTKYGKARDGVQCLTEVVHNLKDSDKIIRGRHTRAINILLMDNALYYYYKYQKGTTTARLVYSGIDSRAHINRNITYLINRAMKEADVMTIPRVTNVEGSTSYGGYMPLYELAKKYNTESRYISRWVSDLNIPLVRAYIPEVSTRPYLCVENVYLPEVRRTIIEHVLRGMSTEEK